MPVSSRLATCGTVGFRPKAAPYHQRPTKVELRRTGSPSLEHSGNGRGVARERRAPVQQLTLLELAHDYDWR